MTWSARSNNCGTVRQKALVTQRRPRVDGATLVPPRGVVLGADTFGGDDDPELLVPGDPTPVPPKNRKLLVPPTAVSSSGGRGR